MSRRYSSLLIRRLQGAVHWSMLASRHGRNQRQRSSPSSMSRRAGAELEDPLQHLHRPAQGPRAGERAVELHAAVRRLAGDLDAREVLAGRDLQVGKRLVVLQLLVVLRLDVLDQPRFHQQGIDLAVALDVIDVGDLVDPRRGAVLVLGPLQKVAAGPAAEVLRLADVDHPAGGVLHQVDAGRPGKLADLGGGPAEGEVVRDRGIVSRRIQGRLDGRFIDRTVANGLRLGFFIAKCFTSLRIFASICSKRILTAVVKVLPIGRVL